MKRFALYCLIGLLSFGSSAFAQGPQSALFTFLKTLPVYEINTLPVPDGYEEAYEILIEQPLDHNEPEGEKFQHRVFLSHKSKTDPMVLVTEGYARNRNYLTEVTNYLGANQLIVEHRYFGNSVPETEDWQYLRVKQASDDLHRITALFKAYYNGSWINTGISKGGQTTLAHRYFYPNDVDVSIPYVAPLNFSLKDQRIYDFLDNVGDAECRAKIKTFQKEVLSKREEIMPRLTWFSKGKKFKFSYMTIDEAFEYSVLEYPFGFWQWGTSCDDIPSKGAHIDDLLSHLVEVVGYYLYADEGVSYFGPHYYQSARELGYYGFKTDDFKGQLEVLSGEPSAIFAPEGIKIPYSNELALAMAKWFRKKGDQIVYIYGANDTWSATAVEIGKRVDALKFMMEGRHHGDARIKNLSITEKQQLSKKLSTWLKTSIELN